MANLREKIGVLLFSSGLVLLFGSPACLVVFRFALVGYSWVFFTYMGITVLLLVVGFGVAKSANGRIRGW